jgi:hypothetical protein
VGQYEKDEKDDELRRAWAVYRGGPSAPTVDARQSNTARASGQKQAEGSVAACGMSERWVQSGPVFEDPPGYEDCSPAASARQDGADVRMTLSESRVEVETTRLFGVPVVKRTFRLTRLESNGGLEGSPTCVQYWKLEKPLLVGDYSASSFAGTASR